MNRKSILVAMGLLVCIPLSADIRSHLVVTKNRNNVYTFTKIEANTESTDSLTGLIEAPDGTRLILEEIRDYGIGTYTYTFRTPEEVLVTVVYEMPFSERTRSGVRSELRSGKMNDASITVRISSNGEKMVYTEDEILKDNGVRREILARADPGLVASLQKLENILVWPEMTAFCGFTQLLTGTTCPNVEPFRTKHLKFASAQPDCSFDESFGYPCDEEQLKRVEAAESEGDVLKEY